MGGEHIMKSPSGLLDRTAQAYLQTVNSVCDLPPDSKQTLQTHVDIMDPESFL